MSQNRRVEQPFGDEFLSARGTLFVAVAQSSYDALRTETVKTFLKQTTNTKKH